MNARNFLIFLLLLLINLMPQSARTTDVSGPVSGTWTAAGNPYLAVDSIWVPDNATLIIQPGVQVIFQGHYKFKVLSGATLRAIGTEEDSIIFTTPSFSINWHGIRFLQSSDSSRLEYCYFTHGSAVPYSGGTDYYGGAIYCQSSSPTIQHCTISSNSAIYGGGIACSQGAHPIIMSNLIHGNHSNGGGGIYCTESSSPLISQNILSGNSSIQGGGIGCRTNATPWIQFNYIIGNGAVGGESYYDNQGGGIHCEEAAPLIQNNFITGNYAVEGGGIFQVDCPTTTIEGNTVISNIGSDQGGGLDIILTNTFINGNVVSGNRGGINGGGGIRIATSNCTVTENQIYSNEAISSGKGGGLSFYGQVICIVNDNTFMSNSSTSDHGGAIYLSSQCTGSLTGNLFQENTTSQQGGGVYLGSCNNIILNSNLFAGNTASQGGGGLSFYQASPNVINCTFSNNISSTGGGIHCLTSSAPVLVNSIFWGNTPQQIFYDGTSDPQVTYCDIQGGWTGLGNLNLDPLFAAGPSGTFYLSQLAAGQAQQSPCVDAGNTSAPLVPGTTRTDEVPDSGIVDMGFHYQHFVPVYPQVQVDMEPVNPPVQIPTGGGSFDFNVTISNNDSLNQTFAIWCDVTMPGGAVYGPLLGPITLTLPVGASITRLRTQFIPAGAPSGSYDFNIKAGEYLSEIWDSDSFPFTKLGAQDGDPLWGWRNRGQNFTEISNSNTASQDRAKTESSINVAVSPNPFNPSTVIRLNLPQAGQVRVVIYDLQGRLISELANGWCDANIHNIAFNAEGMAAGIYFCHIQAGEAQAIKKLMLLK